MKHRISVSLGIETLQRVKERLRDNSFRNQSHLVEFAVNKLLEENAGGKR